MVRLLSGATLLAISWLPAAAQGVIKEGRSVSICSDTLLVCAVARDGAMTATSECKAQRDGAARILPGDCEDPD